jgi:iron complex outermembrane receptor protein
MVQKRISLINFIELDYRWNAAYTTGQYKNTQGKWQELDAIRIAPLKGTVYSDWQFDDGIGVRVQALAIGGTDKARQDAIDSGSTRPPAEIKVYNDGCDC